MLNVEIDHEKLIAVLTPSGPLSKEDFAAAAKQIDPLVEQAGQLMGLVIHTENFPGWDSFSAMTNHFRFVRDHHQEVKRVAIVTNSPLGDIADTMVNHFVAAEIKHFPYANLAEAKQWITESSEAED